MKIERTKNAKRNIISGGILKILQILLPFVMRTAMIYVMGVQYLGLNSLFTSVLEVLNLAELGVGSAMVYSMYKPIAEDDGKRICALMRLYKIYYRIIGLVIAVVGLLIMPIIPHLVKSDLPKEINLFVLYLLNLGTTVLTYWLFAYKNSLLLAHQRKDIESKISLITTSIKFLLQIAALIFTRNYYVFLIVALLSQVVNNIITAIIATNMYPKYNAKGKLSRTEIKTINHRIRDLFTSKIGSVVVNSADTVVISAFLGLTTLAIYQNYYFIMKSVIGIVAVVFASCTAGIGNSIIVETQDKNYNDLKKFTFIISWIAGFCCTCLVCIYQPFMNLWVGNELMIGMPAVICLCIYYYIVEINALLNLYKDAAGIWHEDRFRPLVTAIANLSLNLIIVQFWGLCGVILSTVISMLCIGMPWLIHNLFTEIFKKDDLEKYVKHLIGYAILSVISAGITYVICLLFHFGLISTLIIRFLICCIVPNTVFFFAYRKLDEFRDSVMLIDRITQGKFGLKRFLKKA